ncbi:hypothetical protein [Halomicrobium sp. LC1Hm]|uniref:hypothetical protein n=1 Tax=Halomicrobium sp. LC1Hm TaxID=2610902 RepID=UPI00129839D2|nr:hypothetical protein [Halomicrobium sp. LC1Hm]QGA81094.1 putative membrane protein [Halomicrobium sp. LC1Hm]
MIDLSLSEREKSLVVATAAVTFVVGFWAGLWSVPPQAFDVPMTASQEAGETAYSLAYRPVPTSLPLVSVAVPAIAVLYLYRDSLVEDSPEAKEVPADD